jgi:hypothetical protein
MSKIKCTIEEITLEGDYSNDVQSVRATCNKCDHTTESYGTSEGSIKRCLALMHEECPEGEDNRYEEELPYLFE